MSNENNGSAIWLKVKLSPDMHKRLKVMAAENGQTLQGLVVQILEKGGQKVGGEVVGSAQPVPTIRPQDGIEPVRDGTAGDPKKYSAYTS